MYEFWGDAICDAVAEDVQALAPTEGRFVVNVASQEYFKSVDKVDKTLRARGVTVVTCAFPGPAVHAKAARGAMCRYVVLNEVTDVEGLKGFAGNDGEWSFASERFPDGTGLSVTLTFHRTNVGDAKKKKGAAEVGGAAKGKRPTAATEKAGAKRTRGKK